MSDPFVTIASDASCAAGATIDRQGRRYSRRRGYAVALVRGTAAIAPAEDPAAVADAMRRVAERWHSDWIGIWRSGAEVHVDPVAVIEDHEAAIAAGHRHAQLAIYDFAEQREIKLAA